MIEPQHDVKKLLKFGKWSLDDSYKKDSYKEKSVYTNVHWGRKIIKREKALRTVNPVSREGQG